MEVNKGTKNRFEDDDEDLEFLRLAALKTLPNKKENVSTQNSPVSPHQQLQHISTYPTKRNNPTSFSHAPTTTYKNHNDNYSISLNRSALQNPVENYENRQRLQKLDINEPYVPQCVQPAGAGGYSKPITPWLPDSIGIENLNIRSYNASMSYQAAPLHQPISSTKNVQLSPRSEAFVAQNNDILARRKGDRSPHYFSQSPTFSPWSPTSKHNYRRSISRSPPLPNILSRQQSPVYIRRRSLSRSPTNLLTKPRNLSPSYRSFSSRSPSKQQISQNKRLKSRSPLQSIHQNLSRRSPVRRSSRSPPTGRLNRKASRSPIPVTSNTKNISRVKSPYSKSCKYQSNRNKSPTNRKKSPGGDVRSNRHRSPVQNYQQNRNLKRKSSSPYNKQQRHRSATPNSPLRKYPRRNREDDSPKQKKTKNYMNGGGGLVRSRGRNATRKSHSISPFNRKQRSRSKPLEKLQKIEESQNDRNTQVSIQHKKYDRNPIKISKDEVKHSKDNAKPEIPNEGLKELDVDQNENCDMISLTPPPPPLSSMQPLIPDQNNKSEIQSENDENNRSDNEDDDDDGIDLFPSDESESENEGRFKSSRAERKVNVPTLSFAKLNETSAPTVVNDLHDVYNKSSRNERNDDRGFNRRRVEERFRKTDSSRNSRSDRRRKHNSRSRSDERKNNANNGKVRRFESDDNGAISVANDGKRKNDEKPMFKSTFQAVENEVSSRINSKVITKSDKGSGKDNYYINDKSKKRFTEDSNNMERSKRKQTGRNNVENDETIGMMTDSNRATKSTTTSVLFRLGQKL